jgi:hypothetical protein
MNGPEWPSDELNLAERRLSEHLELLRSDPPKGPSLITAHVVRTARWQRSIRRPLLAIAALTAAIGDGVRLLLRSPTDRP